MSTSSPSGPRPSSRLALALGVQSPPFGPSPSPSGPRPSSKPLPTQPTSPPPLHLLSTNHPMFFKAPPVQPTSPPPLHLVPTKFALQRLHLVPTKFATTIFIRAPDYSNWRPEPAAEPTSELASESPTSEPAAEQASQQTPRMPSTDMDGNFVERCAPSSLSKKMW